MAGSKVAGAWKIGDPPPNKDEYQNANEFEADDTRFRQWKKDNGGSDITAPGSQHTAGSKTIVNPNTRRIETLTSTDAPAPTGREGETDLGAAARAAAAAKKKADEEERRKKKTTYFQNFRSGMSRMG